MSSVSSRIVAGPFRGKNDIDVSELGRFSHWFVP